MSLRWVIVLLMPTLALAGCGSTNVDLIPVPSTEGALKVSDDGVARLQVQVQNQGIAPVESSPVTIRFFLPRATVTSAIQDGGPLQPGEASRVMEFEIPQLCLEEGCGFQVAVDPEKQLKDEERSNNLARGRCEGQIASE